MWNTNENKMNTIEKLIKILEERKKESPKDSYTSSLLNEGVEVCCKKLGEESSELIIACMRDNKEKIKNETADLIYHLLVLLISKKIDFKDVLGILEGRMKMSGLEEKKNRKSN